MTNALRVAALALYLGLLFPIPAEAASVALADGQRAPAATIAVKAFTTEQQQLVDEARGLFASTGLTLPAVAVNFPADPERCFQNGGVYIPSQREVRICRPSLKTMVHELAHAWVETSLSVTEQGTFLDLRDLDTWVGGQQWDKRGAEHAAEIITWGVMQTDISVRWIETNADGTTTETTRLFKIADTDRDELLSAYRQLTGELPQKRMAADQPDFDTASPITSPEAR